MKSVARSSATLADQPTASGTPAPTSDWHSPAASACDVWQPLKKTHWTGAAAEDPGDDLGRRARVGPAALVLEREGALTVAGHPAVTRQVHDMRAAFGHQLDQLLEAAQLGELDGHARQPGRGPQHGVLLALVVELGLVDRGGGQEQDAERARPQRAIVPDRSSPGDRRSDHAASHPTGRSGASSTSSQGKLSTRRSALRMTRSRGPGPSDAARRPDQAGSNQVANRPRPIARKRFRIDQRPAALLEQFQETTLQVGHRLGVLALDHDRPADRLVIPGPLASPTRGVVAASTWSVNRDGIATRSYGPQPRRRTNGSTRTA